MITVIMKNIMIPLNQIFDLLLLLTILLSVSPESVSGHDNGRNINICPERERQALLKFKSELTDFYGRLSSWGTGENKMECCKWRGVRCDNRTNHVVRLNLRGPAISLNYVLAGNPVKDKLQYPAAPLTGKISSPLLELKHLTYLDLSSNYFDPRFPEFICSLTELHYLNLSHAGFKGPIPQCVGNLSKLLYLDLSGFYGFYGKSLDWVVQLHSLEYLDLSFVDLHEVTNWLQPISKLSSIKKLYLINCSLHDIPYSLPSINASAPLEILDFSLNQLSYNITSLIYWLPNYSRSLKWIDFSFNMDLDDPNPYHLVHMTPHTHVHPFGNGSNLIYLGLRGNLLVGQLSQLMMSLFGPLGTKLRYLDLSTNMLNGSLPDMSRFSFLTQLKLNNNYLSGFVSKDLLQLPHLRVLDLSDNQIMGPVPDLSFCSSLKELYLYKNMFNGTLTESIGRLSELEVLSIQFNRLEGVITEAHMLNLSRLRILDISFNLFLDIKFDHLWVPPFQLQRIRLTRCNIGPRFPTCLRTQNEVMYLDISNTDISDTIPKWFGELSPNLLYLNASNNKLYGVFPNISVSTHKPGVSVYLLPMKSQDFGVILDISRNRISSSLTFLCHITSWSLIDLSDNMLSGKLPNCFASFEKLEYLNLANNNLFGTIPYLFGALQGLKWLVLRNNSLSGIIPKALSNCTSLQIIDLGQNRLTGNIPTWVGRSFRMITVLSLRSNEFTGSIPLSLCGLTELKILDLSSNKVSGAIPKCIWNLSAMTKKYHKFDLFSSQVLGFLAFSVMGDDYSNFASMYTYLSSVYLRWKGNEVKYSNSYGLLVNLIDLSCNTLSGEIPDELTKLVGLHALNLSRNNLTSHIPHNIALLNSLQSLDLSWNHIWGSIPTGLSNLDSLGVLNLSYNNLSGKIPPQMLKFDESSYMGNPLLCGRPILNRSCPVDDETHGDLDFNNVKSNVEHEENEFITQGFYISLAFGFIFGFWVIIGTIIANESFRYAFFKTTIVAEDHVHLVVVLLKNRLKKRWFSKS
ncbi:receptor-like protein EIX1 [Primulina huaijiensis]|uniref:receptor-like protein EIX1 n=1 Tax=Primulina huaijiensis TaxID=1492673 RepID=UPI003CC740EE